MKENTIDLFKVYNDENFMSHLTQNSLPIITETTSNELFIDPHTKSIINQIEIRTKWLLFDSDNKPVHGHDYPMVRLPKVGYLMKISVPITTDKSKISDFVIDYYVDIRNIDIVQISNLEHGGSVDEMNVKTNIGIKPFDIADHPELHSMLLERNDFFEKYVKDVLE